METLAILARDFKLRAVWAIGLLSLALYGVIAWLSTRFLYGEGYQGRPILLVLCLFGIAFAGYLSALAIGLRVKDQKRLLVTVVFFDWQPIARRLGGKHQLVRLKVVLVRIDSIIALVTGLRTQHGGPGLSSGSCPERSAP